MSCGREMANYFVQTRDQQIAYDVCESCGGLWLDGSELDKMAVQVDGSIEYSSTHPEEGKAGKPRSCPRCRGKELDQVKFLRYGDIALDRCPHCGGFWLDGQELDAINRDLARIMPVHGEGFSVFLRHGHIPYWYKRVRRPSRETDFEVKVLPLQGAQVISDTACACPACQSPLKRYRIGKLEFEGCPECRGMFLDEGELRKLKDWSRDASLRSLCWMDDEVEAIEKTGAVVSKRLCPKCDRQAMLTTNFGESDVLIDYCTGCHGIWLDEDELDALVKHLYSKLDSLTTGEMAKKACEEVKEIFGGPEGVFSEVKDAIAALGALGNVAVFRNPKLAAKLLEFQKAAASVGLR